MCSHEWKWNKNERKNWRWKVWKIISSQLENDEIMWLIMKKLHEQWLQWRPHGRNFPTLAFLCVNDESLVDVKVPQVFCCIFSYNRLLGHVILEQKTRLKKNLVLYFKSNELTTLEKHVIVDHGLITKKIEEKINKLKDPFEKLLTNIKWSIVNAHAITNFWGHRSLQKRKFAL